MPAKITSQDVIRINELYLQLHTYAAVARELGISPTTVKKYVKPDYVPQDQIPIHKFSRSDIPPFHVESFLDYCDNFWDICKLSKEEETEIHELWDELPI